MTSSSITVPASFDHVLEKDAALPWSQQIHTHRVLYHQLTDHTNHRANETTLAHWMLRVKGFVERRVPMGFTTIDPKEVPQAVAAQLVAEDCAKAVEHLVLWDGAADYPTTMHEMLSMYLRAGYADVNGKCNVDGNDLMPVTFLEAAMSRGNLDAAAALINLGADPILVPSVYKTVMNLDGTAKTIRPGDIFSYIDYLERQLDAGFAPVRAAIMSREIEATQGALQKTQPDAEASPKPASPKRRASL